MKPFKIATAGVIALFLLIFPFKLWESVDNNEVLIVQDIGDGELHFYTSAGIHWQGFGKVTIYPKSKQVSFDGTERPLIRMTFNDKGYADVPVSGRCVLPLDKENLTKLHTMYQDDESLIEQLYATTIIRGVSVAGVVMSSTESYAERKTEIFSYATDQVIHGMYQTNYKERKEIDPLTGVERTVSEAEILKDAKGVPLRTERSDFEKYGISFTNLTFGKFDYDEQTDKQIVAQKNNTLKIQTSIAEAKSAEQAAITSEQQGKADAAKAKWEQEKVKAEKVTIAQREKEVAEMDVQTAAAEKRAQILRAEGEAEQKRLLTQANNNLDAKLAATIEINKAYAEALKGSQWVPTVQSGGGKEGGSSPTDLFTLIQTYVASQINK